MKAIRVCVVVALVAVVLTGCKGPATDPPMAESTSGSSPSPTPTPTQARETGLVAPAQVFRGDCEALFTAAEIGQILGAPATARDKWELVEGNPRHIEQHGGIRCGWWTLDSAVNVIVLPEDAVDYSAPTGCDIQMEGGLAGCSLESVQHGIRISGVVFRADSDMTLLIPAQTALLELFIQRADGMNTAPLPIPAAGAWAWPVNCATVVAAGDFSAVPGLGASVQGWPTDIGDVHSVAADLALLGDLPPYCMLGQGEIRVSFTVFGGGRWAEGEVTAFPGATTVAVGGIDNVVLSPGSGNTRVDAFDGPNWVTFYVRYPSNAGVMAQALVAALDTTAIE